MLDVVLPVSIPNVPLAAEAVARLESHTDVPIRVIAVVDGGIRSDLAPLEAALRGLSSEWVLLQEERVVYLNACIRTGLAKVERPFVAFVQPHVHILDRRWFGKLQQVLMKDQLGGFIDTAPDAKSSSTMPVRRGVHQQPAADVPLALMTKRFAQHVQPPDGCDPVRWWWREAHRLGFNPWHHAGVTYLAREHEPHAWHVPSVAIPRSESRSPTTPRSSTRTTTAPVGFMDSEL